MNEILDALIIGGGPAGATAAILLARAGWSVAVVERKSFPRRKVCGEYLSATNLPLLQILGVADVFRNLAGPDVCRVGLFAGDSVTTALLPLVHGKAAGWGRALSREHLDTMLLARACKSGASVYQPSTALRIAKANEIFACQIRGGDSADSRTLRARIIVSAHGSWEPGKLPTQSARLSNSPSDLLGFKAHFRDSNLADGLMPLLAFPGGYGGMVHCENGKVSLSCCIRRDVLTQLRTIDPADAGEVVFEHILKSCRGVRESLSGADREGSWLSAGPIRPGIRIGAPPGIFRIGNAAGEAHPVVAEGISMAMQSAWLLSSRLIAWRRAGAVHSSLSQVSGDYTDAWRRSFASRIHASRAIARWAMSPSMFRPTLPLLRTFPQILSWGARVSGKTRLVVTS